MDIVTQKNYSNNDIMNQIEMGMNGLRKMIEIDDKPKKKEI